MLRFLIFKISKIFIMNIQPVLILLILFIVKLLNIQNGSSFLFFLGMNINLIRSQCILSLPPESIRKPHGFLMFSGVRERVHWERMGSCKDFRLMLS